VAGRLFLYHKTVKVTTPKKMPEDSIEEVAELVDGILTRHLKAAQEEMGNYISTKKLTVQVTH
jgi:hypothetical protein